jgi:hypothetical protein
LSRRSQALACHHPRPRVCEALSSSADGLLLVAQRFGGIAALGRMELVEPLRARHPVVDLDEDGTRPISAAMYSALVPRLK